MTSLYQLHRSAVLAFPNTRKRQYAVDPVKMVELAWTPFLGLKTLFLRGLAQNFDDGGGEYHPIMLFKKVKYGEGYVDFIASDGKVYQLAQPLKEGDQDVSLRCDCGDFFWRFNYYNSKDHSLYGRVRKKYEQFTGEHQANPKQMPGMCKHLMSMARMLKDSGVLIP